MKFKRILIANRGEIALRIMRSCRELGIGTVAVYSEADAQALHVRSADYAVPIGPAPAPQSYLRPAALIQAALDSQADAIHPGYGFLSENAEFARQCAEAGLVFIGPPPEAISAMGGKIEARAIAKAAGVPVVPGYDGPDQSEATLLAEAKRIGFPLLIKASAGGGGKGMRIVDGPATFAAALAGAQREAEAAFGNAAVFLERLIQRPRHIEIQILADSHGNMVHLGERECSIQRRHQKILEEAPAISPELRAEMGAAALRLARAADYVNAGTVEFVADQEGNYYFLEMNTRLQVEHPVTELLTGLDLVRLQIEIATGGVLPFTQEDISLRGHAIEVRLYAEDPQSFLPAPGHVLRFVPPQGPGIRIDAGLESGDDISVYYDPLIAKLSVAAATRAAAIDRLRQALDALVVLGLTTNLPLLRGIAAHPAFAAGNTTTDFLREHPITTQPSSELPFEVLAAAAIWGQSQTKRLDQSPFAQPWRGQGIYQPISYQLGQSLYQLELAAQPDGFLIRYQQAEQHVTLLRASEQVLLLSFADATGEPTTQPAKQERFSIAADAADIHIAWRGWAYTLHKPAALSAANFSQAQSANEASLQAPMPGTLINILVSPGEEVVAGQALLILEAMKMEHTIVAPYNATVRHLPYPVKSNVQSGVPLIELEKHEGG